MVAYYSLETLMIKLEFTFDTKKSRRYLVCTCNFCWDINPLNAKGIYTSFSGHLRDHKCFSQTTTGVCIRRRFFALWILGCCICYIETYIYAFGRVAFKGLIPIVHHNCASLKFHDQKWIVLLQNQSPLLLSYMLTMENKVFWLGWKFLWNSKKLWHWLCKTNYCATSKLIITYAHLFVNCVCLLLNHETITLNVQKIDTEEKISRKDILTACN